VSKTRFQGTNIFQKKGSWFRDIDSRFILFRGVNFASRSKIAPYLPIAPPDMTEISMSELETEIQGVKKELDLLKSPDNMESNRTTTKSQFGRVIT
jgi:hypothetical protein